MIIDQADVMVMQNWSHTTDVADIVNKTPEKVNFPPSSISALTQSKREERITIL